MLVKEVMDYSLYLALSKNKGLAAARYHLPVRFRDQLSVVNLSSPVILSFGAKMPLLHLLTAKVR